MARGPGLVTALLAVSVSVARAQPAPDVPADGRAQPAPGAAAAAARERAISAKASFDRGDYVAAIADYREAYRLLPTPGLLYNLAQAYRLAGDCASAAAMYRDYLRLVPSSPYRATAEQNLAAAEACAREATTPSSPSTEPAPTEPASTEPASTEPAPTEPANAATELAPVPPAPIVRSAPRHRALALVTGGAGVALLAAGAYFAVDAHSAAREVSDVYARGGAWAEIADADARGRRDRVLAIIGLSAGGAALAVGAGLYWLGRPGEARHLAIAPGRTRTDVVMTWQF